MKHKSILTRRKTLKIKKGRGGGWFELDYNLPGFSKAIFEKYGQCTISSIDVRRCPLRKVLTGTANAATLGGLNASMQKHGVEKLFHTSSILHLTNGINLLAEKNEVVVLQRWLGKEDPGTESIHLSDRNLTVNELFSRMESSIGKEALYKYNPSIDNCQKFAYTLATCSGPCPENYKEWIQQPTGEIAKDMPYTNSVANGLINVAAKANQMYQNLPRWGTRPWWMKKEDDVYTT